MVQPGCTMITLASDFGTPYPAAMKGVILQRSDARLVDIAHDFPPTGRARRRVLAP